MAAARHYKLIVVIPDKMSTEKIQHLHGLGADVRITRTDVDKHHPENYVNLARHIAETTPADAWFVDQFSNPANPLAHERTTGPEIWRQMNGVVDAVVCGVGSGGTITGLNGLFCAGQSEHGDRPGDPAGSLLADYIRTGALGPPGSYAVEGIGQSAVPAIADLSRVKKAYTITDARTFEVARALLREAGILAGSSSGTLVGAALEYCREQNREPKRVVTLICDSGSKYLSKMFNDFWMRDQGSRVPKSERLARPYYATLPGRRGDHGGPGRLAAHGLPADAAGRHFAGSSNRERHAGGDSRRVGRADGGSQRCESISGSGAHGDDFAAAHTGRRRRSMRFIRSLTKDWWRSFWMATSSWDYYAQRSAEFDAPAFAIKEIIEQQPIWNARHPRGPAARCIDRRHHDADLRHQHVRAEQSRRQ